MPFRARELVGEDGGGVVVRLRDARWRHLRELLEGRAAQRLADGRNLVRQAEVMREVTGADGDLRRAGLSCWSDVVVQRAEADAVGTPDQVRVGIGHRDRDVVFADDDVTGVVQLRRGVEFLTPSTTELRLAAQKADDRLGGIDAIGPCAGRAHPVVAWIAEGVKDLVWRA